MIPQEHFQSKRTWGPEPKYPTVLSIPHKKKEFITIAGPCSIENDRQVESIAQVLSQTGCKYMRGGVFRAGTYPPDEFGLDRKLMRVFFDIAKSYGLQTVMEVLDIRQTWEMPADVLQVGARHMQDYTLLNELSKSNKPIILKRNMGATLDEFLGAAEYLVRNGKKDIMLCERGSATHMKHVRWDLSLSLVAAIKRMTGLPILVDASHGTGRRDIVLDMTLAGIAAGADGYIVEVHPAPQKSLSDADQALPLGIYPELHRKAEKIWRLKNG
ncbi:MAG: 3-deoxy-7-phosphoheptulonate synthase [Endomicrobiia bacterium]|nr:3-deoxy-7-phosphoheptulonate synthase [Endomicrobiia bacterium]